ncbi:MAG: hypoxanthine phosphoribosyltransferase [Bacteroidetes bacterium]|jgi:hypoxanthine phosphoribosyltransferase|nr:hypoxanthine phosphoribosyltransferase [Bacteroidota bacterium]
MDTIQIRDKFFSKYLSEQRLVEGICEMAGRINNEMSQKEVVFLGILNGAYLFAAELTKNISFPCTVSFLKLASYQGTGSTGKVKRLIGVNEELENKSVVVVEDIVDTGFTLDKILKQLSGFEPKEIKVASMLFKPEAYRYERKPDYIGFEIPNEFMVGYGLDYNGYGRNLKHLYKIMT